MQNAPNLGRAGAQQTIRNKNQLMAILTRHDGVAPVPLTDYLSYFGDDLSLNGGAA